MDNATQQPDELMRYFDKEMTETERMAFEEKLGKDMALAGELESLENTRKAVMIYGINNQVSAIRKERKAEKTPVVKMTPWKKILTYSSVAAACLVLVFISINQFKSTPASGDSLYAAQYIRFEPAANRGTETTADPLVKLYNEKKYDELLGVYSAGTSATPQQMMIAGAAALEDGRAGTAIEILKSLLAKNRESGSNAYNDDAMYYLSLGYLKNRDYRNAAETMEKISKDAANVYHSKFSDDFISKVKKLIKD